MHLPATRGRLEDRALQGVRRRTEDDERQEDQGREEGIEKQDGNDGIRLERLFLKRVVAA